MAPYEQFILFGDSITQRAFDQAKGFAFGAELQNDYIRRLDVINRGFSGYNTSQGLKALPSFMPTPDQAKVRFMTIFFGANDACLPSSDGSKSQHVPLNKYRENLIRIIEHPTVEAQNPRLILITPPPVDEYLFEKAKENDRRAEHTRTYADVVQELGLTYSFPVVDLWKLFMNKAGWSGEEPLIGSKSTAKNDVLPELLSDGVHLTSGGYQILYAGIMDVIRKAWPDQDPDRLPFVLPLWGEAPSE